MNVLDPQIQLRVVLALADGNSLRGIRRQTGVHRDTVGRLLLRVGRACALLHDKLVRKLICDLLELDEIWTFVGKKEGHLRPDDPAEFGDQGFVQFRGG